MVNEWITGTQETEKPCSFCLRSPAMPCLPTSGVHTIKHTFDTHTLPSIPCPGTRKGNLSPFSVDPSKGRSLPNKYFPGTIRLGSVSVMEPE
jgi:hypothetical protein